MALDGKQIKNGSVKPTQVDFSTAALGADPAIRSWVTAQIQTAVSGLDAKNSVRVATATNIVLTAPGATIDGVTMAVNDRVLLIGQTTASQNGIYVYQGSAATMTRSLDAVDSNSLNSEVQVPVEEGTSAGKIYKLITPNPITVGTTALTFQLSAVFTAPIPPTTNKGMAASVTTADGQVACATAITATPAPNSYVEVCINGVEESVGNGVKTSSCYFSGDSGTTARTYAQIVVGDKLYWNGSIAGYQLAATDTVTFDYVA